MYEDRFFGSLCLRESRWWAVTDRRILRAVDATNTLQDQRHA